MADTALHFVTIFVLAIVVGYHGSDFVRRRGPIDVLIAGLALVIALAHCFK